MNNTIKDTLHTVDDLAEWLNRSHRQVLDWVTAYGWPCVRIGRKVYFTDSDLRAILEQHRREGDPVLARAAATGQTPRSIRAARRAS